MVAVLVLVVVVALTMFLGGFTPEKHVAVVVPRSGLVMDPDAKVKFRGAEIGRVGSVESENGQVRLELDLNPDLMPLVPGNALVDIRSTTVFGAKYVNFVEPADPAGRLRPGQELRGESVTVEFNTLFERLTEVLDMVEPAKLNATLTALGTALQGRGAQLGDLLVNADTLLREINPSMPALRHDFQATAAVTNLYADTAPDLLRTVDNATALSHTLTENEQNFDTLLLETIGLADTTGAVLAENEPNLVTALDLLRPTSELLNEYKPALSCVIRGIAKAMPLAEDLFGGRNPGASFNASFMYGAPAYAYPEDLPKVAATGGPRCDGVVERVPGSHADYVVTDTSEVHPFIPSTRIFQNHPTVFEVLFAGMPGMR
ncbi:MCE family protein [Nocardia carnea]|uniref:MCE family protein n=1 Tax=Nocardia carnea TaxID=37328 RepID=UPI002455860E|nr:MCE family protein [Nocardia carnea]